MTRKIILLWCILFLGSAVPSFSEMSPEKKMEEIEQRRREIEESTLRELKETNPAAYQERMRVKETSQKITDILTPFREGKLSKGEARNRLTPLVRQMLGPRIKNLNYEVERATKKLEYLRKAKTNPDLLVKEQVDRYLGEGSEEFLYP